MDNNKKNSEAKIRANAKYNKKAYKNIAIRVKPETAEKIKGYADLKKHSVASFIVKACDYIIDNDIDLK